VKNRRKAKVHNTGRQTLSTVWLVHNDWLLKPLSSEENTAVRATSNRLHDLLEVEGQDCVYFLYGAPQHGVRIRHQELTQIITFTSASYHPDSSDPLPKRARNSASDRVGVDMNYKLPDEVMEGALTALLDGSVGDFKLRVWSRGPTIRVWLPPYIGIRAAVFPGVFRCRGLDHGTYSLDLRVCSNRRVPQ
jgi:hypothetical protein